MLGLQQPEEDRIGDAVRTTPGLRLRLRLRLRLLQRTQAAQQALLAAPVGSASACGCFLVPLWCVFGCCLRCLLGRSAHSSQRHVL